MKRPVFSYRPNLRYKRQRQAWAILSAVPEGEKAAYLTDAILFYEQSDALSRMIRESVREELKSVETRQKDASNDSRDELPDGVMEFLQALQEE